MFWHTEATTNGIYFAGDSFKYIRFHEKCAIFALDWLKFIPVDP